MINILNGMIVKHPTISALSKGFSYGYGFFTTIKFQNGILEHWNYHKERVKEHLVFFRLSIDITKLEECLYKTITDNDLKNSRIKITIFQDIDKTSYLITFTDLIIDYKPVELTISNCVRGDDPIFRYKSLNYYNNLKNLWSIQLDYKGRVLETGLANIFIIKNREILTPPSNLSLLSGTFRNSLLDRKEIGYYSISEAIITLDDIKNADNVFITNSIRGIVPVKKIDNLDYDVTIPLQLRDKLNENSTKKPKSIL